MVGDIKDKAKTQDQTDAAQTGDGATKDARHLQSLSKEDSSAARVAFSNDGKAASSAASSSLPELSIDIAKGPQGQGQTKDQSRIAPPPDAKSDGANGSACKPNQTYLNIVNAAMNTMYDPTAMGKPDEVRHRYDCQITDERSAQQFAKRALESSNDPYNRFLDRKETAELDRDFAGQSTGYGIDVSKREADGAVGNNAPLMLEGVYKGSPAALAGLREGDKILSVDGVNLRKLDFQGAVDAIEGKTGDIKHLKVERAGKILDINVKLDEYQRPAIMDKMLPGNVGYIRITDFMQDNTSDDLKAAILKYGTTKGLVIDLRQNGGGQLNEGVRAASLFNNKDELLRIRERQFSDPEHPTYDDRRLKVIGNNIMSVRSDGSRLLEFSAHKDIVNKPVVLLTDGGTASAAEIFAGALKGNNDAITVGEKTFGKCIGQTISRNDSQPGLVLPDGTAVKVTSFKFFTPNGLWLGDGHDDRRGIEPTIPVKDNRDVVGGKTRDAQINTALDYINMVLGGKASSPAGSGAGAGVVPDRVPTPVARPKGR